MAVGERLGPGADDEHAAVVWNVVHEGAEPGGGGGGKDGGRSGGRRSREVMGEGKTCVGEDKE